MSTDEKSLELLYLVCDHLERLNVPERRTFLEILNRGYCRQCSDEIKPNKQGVFDTVYCAQCEYWR